MRDNMDIIGMFNESILLDSLLHENNSMPLLNDLRGLPTTGRPLVFILACKRNQARRAHSVDADALVDLLEFPD